eukprot:GDKI01012528.1.p1 GENE.GDKI01012528.1~~GDKI01012528.1.p1  ORF type:complete len:447 (-),score=90.66 GDKI01012528.1:135-1277(-)
MAYWEANFERQIKDTVEQTIALKNELTTAEFESICQDEFLLARPVVHSAAVEEINAAAKGWTAAENPRFLGASVKDAQRLMGTIVGDGYMRLEEYTEDKDTELLTSSLPENFDSREHWPECQMIGHIRDQAECGSCWAMASTEAFNDRLCIASKGKFTTLLSTQHTTSCCNFIRCASMGCNGGQPGMAWKWFKSQGVVSGGDFEDIGKGDSCWPYEIKPCAHHVDNPDLPPCSGTQSTPRCRSDCSENEYKNPFKQDKHRANRAYSLGGVESIKKNIMEKGPVTAAFTVFEDFLAYKSGVYEHTKGGALGGHAVKIIGWGKENGTDYWLIANSWNESWGDKGLFKIKMGDCGINSMISAGDVSFRNKVSAYPVSYAAEHM